METIDSGTATLTDGVEQTLATITSAGIYIVVWDFYEFADGTIKIDMLNKITSAGASVVMYTHTEDSTGYDFSNWTSEPMIVNHELVVKALSTGNTVPHDLPWQIYRLSPIISSVEGTTTIGGASSTVVHTITVPGIYIWQLQVYDADWVTFYDDLSLPTSGTSSVYEEIDAALYTGTLFRQVGPIIVIGTDDLHITNFTGVEHDFEWSVTKVG